MAAEKRTPGNESTPASKRVRFSDEQNDEDTVTVAADHNAGKPEQARVSTTSKRKNISRINNKKWNRFVTLAKRWEQATTPCEPSFVVLYWQQLRGRRKQLVWTGANHMKKFVENETVQRVFKEVALSRPCLLEDPAVQRQPENQLSRIQLPSDNPTMYRSDVLYKLIPRIVNPKNKRKFYSDTANKPEWYPANVPFKSPNHSKVGDCKMSAEEMREVLGAFMEKCQDRYYISDNSTEQPSEDRENAHSGSCAVPHKAVSPMPPRSLSPDEALHYLSGVTDWEDFIEEAQELRMRVDLGCVTNMDPKANIPSHLIDKTRKSPEGFTALVSTGDGNCMYNSVSILFHGSERYAAHLRLLSVIHALDHFDHYVTMLSAEIQEPDTAQQFLATVANNEEIVRQRPQDDPTTMDVLSYTLKSEIVAAAQDGQYSGFLQILFLAGAIQHPIQQHCAVQYEFYNLLVPPCACCDMYGDVIHIMWVRMIEEASLLAEPNHIIPLLCDRPVSVSSGIALPPLADHVEKTCIMSKLGQCVLTKYKNKKVDWVKCDQCHSWYHCVCVGVCQQVCRTINFICCSDEATNPEVFNWPWPTRGKSSLLMLRDIKSIYPGNGLSDAVIDFYARSFLQSSSVTFLSALTYAAINRFEENKSPLSSLLTSHYATNGHHCDLKKPIIAFPCRAKDFWHWILIAVVPNAQKAFVFDSICNGITPYCMEAVNGIQIYLNTIGSLAQNLFPYAGSDPLVLDPVPVKVAQQKGVECGIHVINNMTILSKLSGPIDDMFTHNMFSLPVNSTELRMDILYECCQISKKYHQARKLKGTIGTGVTLRSSMVDKEQARLDLVANMVTSHEQQGLQVVTVEGKGRGITTTIPFKKGDYICSYSGDLVSRAEGIDREQQYSDDVGCYLFFFAHKGVDMCIDATKDDGSFGRLINHSKKAANITPKVLEVQGIPSLYFEAMRDIASGEEVLYDYNDTRKTTIQHHPWLSS